MSLYETVKAAQNNEIPTVQPPNQKLFNTDNIENENVKAFIEAKSKVAEISTQMDAINARKRFYFSTKNDAAQSAELRSERNAASQQADMSAKNIDWNKISVTDYEAAINATCGVDNKQDGLTERIRDKAYLKLVIDSMSKEEIFNSFDFFMSNEEKTRWLQGVASDEKYKHCLPSDEKLNAYVEETKTALLQRDPRLDPTSALNLDFALASTLDEVHKQHITSQRENMMAYKNATPQNENKKTAADLINNRFAGISDIKDTPGGGGSNGMSL